MFRLQSACGSVSMRKQKCSVAMLKTGKAHLTPLNTGHIPLDADVFPMDNSGTKKEKVSYL